MSIELTAIFNFIDTTLRGDTTLQNAAPGGIWRSIKTDLPANTAPASVYVTYHWQGGHDVLALPAVRLGINDVFLLRAIGPGDNLTAIKAAADRLDTLIQNASGVSGTNTIFKMVRESDFALDEIVNGALVSHLGGVYRAYAK